MSEAPHVYEITMTHGDLIIQVISDDDYFVTKQMQRWFEALFKGVPIPPPRLTAKPAQPSPQAPQEIPIIIPSTPALEPMIPPQASQAVSQQTLFTQTAQVQQYVTEPLSIASPANGPGVDDFVQPAHQDFSSTYEPVMMTPIEPVAPAPVFEQPVENTPVSVESSSLNLPQEDPEPQVLPEFVPIDMSFQQPVETPTFFPAPPPLENKVPVAAGDDFDLLMDSLAADLDTSPKEAITPVTLPFESPVQEIPLSEPVFTKPNPPEEVLMPPVTPEGAVMQASMETSPKEMSENGPPQVAFDFGIPAPPPSEDPALQSLSLASLQGMQNGEDFEKFPKEAQEQTFAEETHFDFSTESIAHEVNAAFDSFEEPAPAIPSQVSHNPEEASSVSELFEMLNHPPSGIESLVMAAYYMSKNEDLEKYTLKDLNSQLLRAGLTPVNHGTLETVVTAGYVQLVPDLTGNASAAEYSITDKGITFVTTML